MVSKNLITDYSYVAQPFSLDKHKVIFRCASGLGPSGINPNVNLGGWYFNGGQVLEGKKCKSVIEIRGAYGFKYPGVINLYLCGIFTTTEEGVYSCIMMNSSKIKQTMRVGVYFSNRSKLLICTPITSLMPIFHLSTQLLQ